MVLPGAVASGAGLHRVSFVGRNVLEVPVGVERYWVTAENATHVLYANYGLGFQSKLVPLGAGLVLTRANSTVGAVSQLSIVGTLPTHEQTNFSLFSLTLNNQPYPPIPSSPVSQPLSPYPNPQSTLQ